MGAAQQCYASTSGWWNAPGCATAPDIAAMVLHVKEDLAWIKDGIDVGIVGTLGRQGCEVSAVMVLEKRGT